MFHKEYKHDNKNPAKIAEKIYRHMCDIYSGGNYPEIEVIEPDNADNPTTTGEFALPEVLKHYLIREFTILLEKKHIILVRPGRIRQKKSDKGFMEACEEKSGTDEQRLFLFSPERIELSCDRLSHYTNTSPADFQEHLLITNYRMHMEIFKKIFPKAVGSKGECQMQTLHAIQPKRQGITMINMGVGPANAKTLTDQIAVLRPSCMIMIGHCGGLKNTQNIGDFLLADKYFRDDHVMGSVLDARVPISSTLILNTVLLSEIQRKKMPFRIGTVFTTNNRDWEYKISYYKKKFGECRAYGIDMESSVVCAQGFRYKIPHATLLMISDKPLHGKPKMAKASQEFYEETKKTHVRIAINAVNSLDKVERTHMTLSGLGFYPGSHMDALMW